MASRYNCRRASAMAAPIQKSEPEYDVLTLVILIGTAVLAERFQSVPEWLLIGGALALAALLWCAHRIFVLKTSLTTNSIVSSLSQVGALMGAIYAVGL